MGIPHGQGIREEIISKGIIDPGPVGSTHRVGPVLTESLLFFAQVDGWNAISTIPFLVPDVVYINGLLSRLQFFLSH